MIDEIEECRLTPVDVVEDEYEWTTSSERLDERANRSERLLGAARMLHKTQDFTEPTRRDRSVLLAVEQCGELPQVVLTRCCVVETRRIPDGFEHRPVRDAFTVGKATSPGDECVGGDARHELLDEAGLPHAGCAEDREKLARAVDNGLLEGVVQAPPFAVATDHGRIEATDGAVAGGDRAQPGDADALVRRFDVDGVSDELVGSFVHKQLIRSSPSLKAECRLDRLTDCVGLASGDDLAGADPDSQRQPGAPVVFQLLVYCCKPFLHLGRGAHSAQRIVLMHDGNPEDRGSSSAERALNGGAVAFEHRE